MLMLMLLLLQGTGVTSYAMHPGWTVTEGVKKSIPGFYNKFKASMRDLHQGTDTIVWLALEVIAPFLSNRGLLGLHVVLESIDNKDTIHIMNCF